MSEQTPLLSESEGTSFRSAIVYDLSHARHTPSLSFKYESLRPLILHTIMEGSLLLGLTSLAFLGVVLTTSIAEDRPLNSSELEMFVDELPHLPKILGFDIVSGVPGSKSLEIGMFEKKWVRFSTLISFLFCIQY